MRRGVRRNMAQDRIEQPALETFESGLGRLDQANRIGALGDPMIAVMPQRLDSHGALARLTVGKPIQLIGLELQEAGERGDGCKRRNRPALRRAGSRSHGRLGKTIKFESRKMLTKRRLEASISREELGKTPPPGVRLITERGDDAGCERPEPAIAAADERARTLG